MPLRTPSDITIAGLDYGLATFGVVLIASLPATAAREAVLDARSWAMRRQTGLDIVGSKEFTEKMMRVREIAPQVIETLLEWNPTVIVGETFEDTAGSSRKAHRAAAPLATGYVDALLHIAGLRDRLFYQNPALLHQFKSVRAQLDAANASARAAKTPRTHSVHVPGDESLTNEHRISAYFHTTYANIPARLDQYLQEVRRRCSLQTATPQ
jgi:hypothetical protein